MSECRPPLTRPVIERAMAMLSDAGFDETDVGNAVAALGPLLADYERSEAARWDAVGAIQDAVLLAERFDPTCGSGRTRTFVADLTRLLRGRPKENADDGR